MSFLDLLCCAFGAVLLLVVLLIPKVGSTASESEPLISRVKTIDLETNTPLAYLLAEVTTATEATGVNFTQTLTLGQTASLVISMPNGQPSTVVAIQPVFSEPNNTNVKSLRVRVVMSAREALRHSMIVTIINAENIDVVHRPAPTGNQTILFPPE